MPIGYDIEPTDTGWVAYLVRAGDAPGGSSLLTLASGRSEKRVRRRAARAVVRELRQFERRHTLPRARVIVVPPTVGPSGGAGDSGAR
jgi:hypothetical protein